MTTVYFFLTFLAAARSYASNTGVRPSSGLAQLVERRTRGSASFFGAGSNPLLSKSIFLTVSFWCVFLILSSYKFLWAPWQSSKAIFLR